MKRTIACLTALLLLAGCGSDAKKDAAATVAQTTSSAATTTTPPSTVPAPTTPAEPTPERSERGNLVKKINEEAGIYANDTGDDLAVEFYVTAITPNYACPTPGAGPPVNGQFIQVSIKVKTLTDLSAFNGGMFAINPNEWSVVGLDGALQDNPVSVESYSCGDQGGQLANGVGPNLTYATSYILDTSQAHGYVVLHHYVLKTGGWEWKF